MVKRESKKATGINNTQIQLNIPAGEGQVMVSMEKKLARWIICGTGNLHIFAACPSCHSMQGGMLFATVTGNFMGAIKAKCTDCGETVNYYIDIKENGIWSMEAVDAKRGNIFK